ncbi:ATP-binding protein [Azospirillum sp. sgz302134]
MMPPRHCRPYASPTGLPCTTAQGDSRCDQCSAVGRCTPYLVLDEEDRVVEWSQQGAVMARQIRESGAATFSDYLRHLDRADPLLVRHHQSQTTGSIEDRLRRHAELLRGDRDVDMLIELRGGETVAVTAWRVPGPAGEPRIVICFLPLSDSSRDTEPASGAEDLCLLAATIMAKQAPVPMIVLDGRDRVVCWNAPLRAMLPDWDDEHPPLIAGMTVGAAVRALLYADMNSRMADLLDDAHTLLWVGIETTLDERDLASSEPWKAWLTAYRNGVGLPLDIGGTRRETMVLRAREARLVMLTDADHDRAVRQAALDAQAAAQAWQQATFSLTPVGIVVTETDGDARIIFANAAVGDIAGRSVPACRGERFLEIFPSALLGDALAKALSEASLIEDGYGEAAAHLGYASFMPAAVRLAASADEVEVALPTGTRWLNVRVALSHYESHPTLTWWLTDITATKHAEVQWRAREAHLQTLIAAAGVAPFELELSDRSPDLAAVRVSPLFWRLLGHSADRPGGTTLAVLIEHIAPPARESFALLLANRRPTGTLEWVGPFRAQDGGTRWLAFRGQVWTAPTDGGDAPRLIGVISDVTRQHHIELGLRQAKEQAEEAARAKSTFLATMSHEIRTPMSAVMGMLDEMRETPLTGDQAHLLDVARESAATLLGILNDILDLSKIEAGKLTTEHIATDPRALLQSVADAHRISASGKGLHLCLSVDDAIPPRLYLDPMRLRQVLFNLVGNAIKFTPAGRVEVRALLVQPDEMAAPRLQIEVGDTGIGMTPEQARRCFSPFSQADGSTTRRYGGTGLGLSICHRLIALMEGTISVRSRVGHGSVFTFVLPVERAPDGATDGTARVHEAASTNNPLAGARVLMAEDTPFVRTLLHRQLVSLGLRVTVVANGREALDALLTDDAFDLVLTDLHMPDMDGAAFTAAWRAHERAVGRARRLPIVVLTADVLAAEQHRFNAAGFDDHLTKPASKAQIRAVLSRWIRPVAETGSPADAIAGNAVVPVEPLTLDRFADMIGSHDPADLLEALGYLIATLDQAALRLEQAVGGPEPDSAQALAEVAHLIKGTARSAGADALATIAATVEAAAKAGGTPPADVATLLAGLASLRHWSAAQSDQLATQR